ncbi:MAG: DUF2628 domain-containing protein [Pseudomonadota bacterium]|jgi:hypothetical protein|nr:MAG: DUF2628 domain-containing protein [Pseudomonadota bacterium]
MAVYTLHVPAGAKPGDARALEEAVVVKDGIAWWALVFPLLWFLWNRLWLGALTAFSAMVFVTLAERVFNLSPGATMLLGLLFVLLLALEANGFRRRALERRGFSMVDAVVADSLESAEARAFARWLSRETPTPAPRSPLAVPAAMPFPAREVPVIGLFPETERRP